MASTAAVPSTAPEDELFTLRDLQEAAALAATGDWSLICNAIPQEVWDGLHERGFVSTYRDITGDAETGATAAGIAYVVERVGGTTHTPEETP